MNELKERLQQVIDALKEQSTELHDITKKYSVESQFMGEHCFPVLDIVDGVKGANSYLESVIEDLENLLWVKN